MELEEFERAVAASADPDALWRACQTFFPARGVARLTYHHLPPLGAPDAGEVLFRADGFPEDVIARYVAERIWRVNPLLQHARGNPEPFYWSAALNEAGIDPAFAAFVAEARAAGVADGLGIEVYGPNGRNGYCGLALPAGRAPLPAQEVADLHWACQLAHLRYCAMRAEGLAPPELSPRESEVLGWVARGKSNAIIGEILGISAHTVDAHLRRIYLKLGVGDRISATLRALGVGLIHAEG